MTDRTLTNLKKKLERWELEHLRQHAADLADRLELATESARQESDNADYWREAHHDLIRQLTNEGEEIGMTRDGQIIALGKKPLVLDALERAERFLQGFEDDPDQDSVPLTLTTVRAAILEIKGGE